MNEELIALIKENKLRDAEIASRLFVRQRRVETTRQALGIEQPPKPQVKPAVTHLPKLKEPPPPPRSTSAWDVAVTGLIAQGRFYERAGVYYVDGDRKRLQEVIEAYNEAQAAQGLPQVGPSNVRVDP